MEDKYRGEQVLVFKRALFETLGAFQGTNSEVESYLDVIFREKLGDWAQEKFS